MYLAHKIELTPNKSQINYFNRACGVARFVYNWALDIWNKKYINGNKPNAFGLKKEFNAVKREQFPFVLEVTKSASEQAFSDLGSAYSGFFKGQNNRPKFKSKKRSKKSFYIANDQFSVNGRYIRIPKLGWVKMREELRFNGKIISGRVSEDGGKWFVSIQIDIDMSEFDNGLPPVGIDLGIKTLFVLSNGGEVENQRFTIKYQAKLRKLNKKLSRQVQGSSNWRKTKNKINRLHFKIRNSRADFVHKATTDICKNFGIIGLEDLNVAGMVKNRRLAKHVQDASFGEIVRQFDYKQKRYGNRVIKISRWFPSSKTCSDCGYVKQDLTLTDRKWICPECGVIHLRDLNAAINIRNQALSLA